MTKFDPGSPVCFMDGEGHPRFGVTDGVMENGKLRVIEVDPVDEHPTCEFLWEVSPELLVYDPEYDQGILPQHTTRGARIAPVLLIALALPLTFAGSVCATVGSFMMLYGDWRGVWGWVIFVVSFYLAMILTEAGEVDE